MVAKGMSPWVGEGMFRETSYHMLESPLPFSQVGSQHGYIFHCAHTNKRLRISALGWRKVDSAYRPFGEAIATTQMATGLGGFMAVA